MKTLKKTFVFILLLLFLLPSTSVLCRAGGGGGSGGGSGGGGGGSSSSGGRGGGSSYSRNDGDYLYGNALNLLVITLFIGSNVLFFKRGKLSLYSISSKKNESLKTLKYLRKKDSSWNFKNIEKQIRYSFPLIQEAWMERDYSPVKELMTENFFNSHTVKMNWMLLKKEKNILDNIKLKKITPIKVNENKDNSEDFIWVLLKASMIDYTINEENNLIIDGNYSKSNTFYEFWKFVKKDDKWLADSILQLDRVDSLNYFERSNS